MHRRRLFHTSPRGFQALQNKAYVGEVGGVAIGDGMYSGTK
jgi:hypothetical protein